MRESEQRVWELNRVNQRSSYGGGSSHFYEGLREGSCWVLGVGEAKKTFCLKFRSEVVQQA